jgi:hypothetical protein
MVVLVARLTATLPQAPAFTGEAIWQDTWVAVPQALRRIDFTDLVSGQTFHARDGRLRLAEVFGYFSGAVLVHTQPQELGDHRRRECAFNESPPPR